MVLECSKIKIPMDESIKIAIRLRLISFRTVELNLEEIEFPSSFSKNERIYVRVLAQRMGLDSERTYGSVKVRRKKVSTLMQYDAFMKVTFKSYEILGELFTKCPLTDKEKKYLIPLSEGDEHPHLQYDRPKVVVRSISKLKVGSPLIPPLPAENKTYEDKKKSLPTYLYQSDILSIIEKSPVSLITGETGCGKSTQVPQYILESSAKNNTPVKVIVAQPRRIAAVSLAKRVADERNEKLGSTVGYQIRLESVISPKTALYFCTTGVLIRSLIGNVESYLDSVTHIIVDEVHERSIDSDLLLTVLKENISKFPKLRVILMSASNGLQMLMDYFPGLKHINVPGKLFPVEVFYLEDILLMLRRHSNFTYWLDSRREEYYLNFSRESKEEVVVIDEIVDTTDTEEKDERATGVTQEILSKADDLIFDAFINGSYNSYEDFIKLNKEHGVSLTYKHSKTGINLLMAAAVHGNSEVIKKLISKGVDANAQTTINNWTAADFAFNQGNDTYELLKSNLREEEMRPNLHLERYNLRFDSELNVDIRLIEYIIEYICGSAKFQDVQGSKAILVFLPGYYDINKLYLSLRKNKKYCVFCLHSRLETSNTMSVFESPPVCRRKIILATNIAETSITIDDVAYVIDSGKVKQMSYDGVMDLSCLKSCWISKSSALQRRGRAGRTCPGKLFCIYSRAQYENFESQITPQMYTSSLTHFTLQCKLLAPPNTSIASFMSKALEVPPSITMRNSIKALKVMGALSSETEDLTELGSHLVDLCVEPHLGKMIFYAIVLRCLDPVLTIVCFISMGQIFNITFGEKSDGYFGEYRKLYLAGGTQSDHMVGLRLFQTWQKAVVNKTEDRFCKEYGVSPSGMHDVMGLRNKILGHLRAAGFVRPRGSGDIKSVNQNSENWAAIKAALVAGHYPYLARFDKTVNRLKTSKETNVNVGKHSVFQAKNVETKSRSRMHISEKFHTEWLIYNSMRKDNSTCFLETVTPVSSVTVSLFAGPSYLPNDALFKGDGYAEESSDSEMEGDPKNMMSVLRIDDWIIFRSSADLLNLILHLRRKFSGVVFRRLLNPSKVTSQADDTVVKSCIKILSLEEKALKMIQPAGIGQRPLAMDNLKEESPRDSDEADRSKIKNNRRDIER